MLAVGHAEEVRVRVSVTDMSVYPEEFHLTQSVYQVVLRKSISAQIRQLILYYY